MNRLFVQFYNINPDGVDDSCTRQHTAYCENGFSSVGGCIEPIWVCSQKLLPPDQRKRLLEADEVWVSLWQWNRLKRIIQWAKKFPEKTFHIGGPLVSFISEDSNFDKVAIMPSNIISHTGTLESTLGLPASWKFVGPDVPEYLLYSKHLNDGCYWGKCSFCHYVEGTREIEIEQFVRELEGMPPGNIWIESPALRPDQIKIAEILDYSDKSYQTFLRAEPPIYDALKKSLPKWKNPGSILFRIGVEFPSNRMLKIMNKGLTVQDLIATINLLNDYGVRKMLLFIFEWQELTREDVEEAKWFFSQLSDKDDIVTSHNMSRLLYRTPDLRPHVGSSEVDLYAGRYWYFKPLAPEVKVLNDEWFKMVTTRPGMVRNPYLMWTLTQPAE